MTALPTKSSFTDAAVTYRGLRQAWNDLHDFISGLLSTTGLASDARATLGLGTAAQATVGVGDSELPTWSQVVSKKYALMPTGTRMCWFQRTAPLGWTQDTSTHDRVIRTVDNTTEGGQWGGSWVISGLSGSVSVAGHAIAESEMPSHDHGGGNHTHTWPSGTAPFWGNGFSRDLQFGGTIWFADGTLDTQAPIPYQGGNTAHGHPGSVANVSQNGAWRPATADAIICTKN